MGRSDSAGMLGANAPIRNRHDTYPIFDGGGSRARRSRLLAGGYRRFSTGDLGRGLGPADDADPAPGSSSADPAASVRGGVVRPSLAPAAGSGGRSPADRDTDPADRRWRTDVLAGADPRRDGSGDRRRTPSSLAGAGLGDRRGPRLRTCCASSTRRSSGAASVVHLAEVAAFATDLVGRGRVLPVALTDPPRALWRPVLTGPDAAWARVLASSMPASVAAAGPQRASRSGPTLSTRWSTQRRVPRWDRSGCASAEPETRRRGPGWPR